MINITYAVISTDDVQNYWDLDDDATDAHGSKNGTELGSIIHVDSGCMVGGCYLLDGIDDRIQIINFSFTTDDYSISWWAKANASQTNSPLFEMLRQIEAVSDLCELYFDDDADTLNWNTGDGDGSGGGDNADLLTVSFHPPTHDWVYYVLVHNHTDGSKQMYINGTFAGAVGDTVDPTQAEHDFYLGGQHDTNYEFTGWIDEVAIFNKSLSRAEVEELYNDHNAFAYPFLAAVNVPNITQSTYNLSSGLYTTGSDNQTSWRSDLTINITTRDTTPTLRFDTQDSAYCRLHTADQNWTTMGNGRNCSTTGSTSHVCSLSAADKLTIGGGVQSIYAGCIESTLVNETTASTSGLLYVNLDWFRLQGYIKHSDGSGYNQSVVRIYTQSNGELYDNLTTNESGHWFSDVYSGNWTYTAYDPINYTQDGEIRYWAEVT